MYDAATESLRLTGFGRCVEWDAEIDVEPLLRAKAPKEKDNVCNHMDRYGVCAQSQRLRDSTWIIRQVLRSAESM